MKKKMVALLAGAMLMMVAGSASAYSISYLQFPPGETSVTNSTDGWTATASGGSFQYKAQDGWSGVGVSGRTGGEIDTTESITFKFDNAQIIKDFNLTLLFSQGPYGDPNEVATVIVNGTNSYFLTALKPASSASWTGSAGAVLTSVTNDFWYEGGAAVWKVENPFGNTAVTNLKFTAKSVVTSGNNSDYTFNSLATTPVPEPATMLLLGLGLLGVAGIRRFKK